MSIDLLSSEQHYVPCRKKTLRQYRFVHICFCLCNEIGWLGIINTLAESKLADILCDNSSAHRWPVTHQRS